MIKRDCCRSPDPSDAPASYRRACSYQAFVPDGIADYAADVSADVAGAVSDAESALLRLNATAIPALGPLARLLLRTESIASSRIEGMQVDARDLARAEVRAASGATPGPTVAEILANVDAMEVAVEKTAAARSLATDDICLIHHRLTISSATPRTAGVIREEQNWIGGNAYNPCGAAYVPPPALEVPRLLADLCAAIVDDRLPPVVQAAIVHAQFETVHPFGDGNGRTGRALIHVVLRRRGITPSYVPPISVVLAADKERYIDGLVAFRNGRVDEWITQFAVAASRAAALASAHLQAVERLQAEWRRLLTVAGAPRAGATAWAVIDVLPAYPVITLPVATAVVGRTKAVVNDALAELERADVLVRLGGGRRNRTWEAVGLLDLITGLEHGFAPPR